MPVVEAVLSVTGTINNCKRVGMGVGNWAALSAATAARLPPLI